MGPGSYSKSPTHVDPKKKPKAVEARETNRFKNSCLEPKQGVAPWEYESPDMWNSRTYNLKFLAHKIN